MLIMGVSEHVYTMVQKDSVNRIVGNLHLVKRVG
jgi:hypothetical protein